jgi:DNA-binding LacI/PurR family transcriptional regulator
VTQKLDPEKPIRLADLAVAAGVSKGTASNVFNRPNIVSKKVRLHVLSMAKKIGYKGPDPKGRLLSAGKVNAIGVVTTEKLATFFTDSFARVLASSIAQSCDQQGIGLSLVSVANDKELVWNMQSAVVDGFILFCVDGSDTLVALSRERSLPVVALAFGKNDKDISVVGVDNRNACAEAADYLASLGHRRFAILTMEFDLSGNRGLVGVSRIEHAYHQTTVDRLLGYFDGLRQHGIDTDRVPVYETQCDEITVKEALQVLFDGEEPPTAILAQSDKIALLVIDWLKQNGWKVPGEVSVMGFDGVPEAQFSEPALTTIMQPINEIGRKAVAAILTPAKTPVHTCLATELVIRASTAPPSSCSDPESS